MCRSSCLAPAGDPHQEPSRPPRGLVRALALALQAKGGRRGVQGRHTCTKRCQPPCGEPMPRGGLSGHDRIQMLYWVPAHSP